MKRRSRALLVCVLSATRPVMDITKVYVTIPDVERSLEASPVAVRLMLMGFVLAFVIVLVPSGRFGDLRSRRGVFLAGLSIFGLASLAAGLAPTTEILVAS